jgi:hypothetical protein
MFERHPASWHAWTQKGYHAERDVGIVNFPSQCLVTLSLRLNAGDRLNFGPYIAVMSDCNNCDESASCFGNNPVICIESITANMYLLYTIRSIC